MVAQVFVDLEDLIDGLLVLVVPDSHTVITLGPKIRQSEVRRIVSGVHQTNLLSNVGPIGALGIAVRTIPVIPNTEFIYHLGTEDMDVGERKVLIRDWPVPSLFHDQIRLVQGRGQ